MPSYQSEGFDPPAPVAQVTVRGLNGRARADVPMLLDTGSDISIVPRNAAEAVDASIQAAASPLLFYDGSRVGGEEAQLVIELLRFRFHGRFVVGDASYGILGRNILNLLTVTFDGPHLTWSA